MEICESLEADDDCPPNRFAPFFTTRSSCWVDHLDTISSDSLGTGGFEGVVSTGAIGLVCDRDAPLGTNELADLRFCKAFTEGLLFMFSLWCFIGDGLLGVENLGGGGGYMPVLVEGRDLLKEELGRDKELVGGSVEKKFDFRRRGDGEGGICDNVSTVLSTSVNREIRRGITEGFPRRSSASFCSLPFSILMGSKEGS